MNKMKSVALYRYLPIDDEQSLLDLEVDKPIPQPRDILVEIKAISVNPIDTKMRAPKDIIEQEPKILGWDASGIVRRIGKNVTMFKEGDEVYYAGDIRRQGSNAQFQIVDERIVAFKPKTLSFEEAAALPLTSITAYESLFDRLNIDFGGKDKGKTILIIGGAGGVGSIAIQLAKLAGLKIIASASRAETIEWVKKFGADLVVNHRQKMKAQIKELGHEYVDYIAIFNDTDSHWLDVAQMIKPQGKIVAIVESKSPLEMGLIRKKSVTFSWEFMFTRPMFETDDMIEQHNLLKKIANLVDENKLRTTLAQKMQPINAKNLKKAHKLLESGKAKGKIVLSGFSN